MGKFGDADDVGGAVFAGGSVDSGDRQGRLTRAVFNAEGEAVHFGFDVQGERLPLGIDALQPVVEILLVVGVGEAEHWLRVGCRPEGGTGRGAHPVGGGVGILELGALRLELLEFGEEAIVFVVADLWLVQLVVEPVVGVQLVSEVLEAFVGVWHEWHGSLVSSPANAGRMVLGLATRASGEWRLTATGSRGGQVQP